LTVKRVPAKGGLWFGGRLSPRGKIDWRKGVGGPPMRPDRRPGKKRIGTILLVKLSSIWGEIEHQRGNW